MLKILVSTLIIAVAFMGAGAGLSGCSVKLEPDIGHVLHVPPGQVKHHHKRHH